MNRIVGKIQKLKAEVITIFRVGGRYYPATELNSQCMEAYLHTGDETYLKGLENALEF